MLFVAIVDVIVSNGRVVKLVLWMHIESKLDGLQSLVLFQRCVGDCQVVRCLIRRKCLETDVDWNEDLCTT